MKVDGIPEDLAHTADFQPMTLEGAVDKARDQEGEDVFFKNDIVVVAINDSDITYTSCGMCKKKIRDSGECPTHGDDIGEACMRYVYHPVFL